MAALELTAQQRKFLRSKAHHLDAFVLVGKAGVTDGLIQSIDNALNAHELIKVRFNDRKDEKKEFTAEIADRTNSAIGGLIGHVAILYRPHPEAEKREIVLPT